MPTTDSSENALRRSQRVRVRPSQYTGMSNTSLFGVLFLCCLFATVSFFLFLLLRTLILFFYYVFAEQDSLSENSDSDNDSRTRSKRKGPRGKNSRPRKKRGPRTNGDDNIASEDENSDEPPPSFDNFIFDAMLDPEVSIAEVATEWIESYKENEITALKDMVNFILKVCFIRFFIFSFFLQRSTRRVFRVFFFLFLFF